jgi:alpha-tubulin suppressor-like RCC1 family protein
MPKDDINYSFTENGIVYDFYDVFVPAENFRQPSLLMWGINGDGAIGINVSTNRILTPVTTFAGGTTWKSVDGGEVHTAAIKTDGTLWTWGRNGNAQLGNFTTTARSTPVTTFAGGTTWKSVSCGDSHTVAIKTDGSLWLWGRNAEGQLGVNNTTARSTPVTTFAGGTDWKSVSAWQNHTAAIKTDGSLWLWGRNNFAQLGVNDTTQRNTPVTTFAGGTDWKFVGNGNGGEASAAIKTDGSLWLWGRGDAGQLGNFASTARSTPVTTFAGGNTWKSVSVGGHTAAIKTDGSLWMWGTNTLAQLGDNTLGSKNTPVTTSAGGTNWKSVAIGNKYTAAIKTDGTLWVWGSNDEGQLGTNNLTRGDNPRTTFAGGNNWKSVSSGGYHTAAIKSGLNVDLS